jgi:hypothetical protein
MVKHLLSDHSPAADYFQKVYDSFLRAEKATRSFTYTYNIGGYAVQQRFAGQVLIDYMRPALAHLGTPQNAADNTADTVSMPPALTVCLWDSASTGVSIPTPTWTVDDYGPGGLITGYNDDRFCIVHQPGLNIMSLIDMKRGLAIYWAYRAEQIPYWKRSFPMRTILHWWTYQRPSQLIHSGAVGLPDGGVLLVGKSGSGKSTTSLACLASPLLYAGDDYMMIQLGSTPYVHSLYNTAKLNADNIFRFPRLQGAISNADRLHEEKALIFLHEHLPEKVIKGFPLRAVFIPRITGALDTSLKRISGMTALQAIAPTTLFHLPGFGHESFQKMASLVECVPSYSLELGTDLAQIPEVIIRYLQTHEH